jgi:hypothetical protein
MSLDFGVGSYREYIPADQSVFSIDIGFLMDPTN